MHNSITLEGTLMEDPQSRYEPSGECAAILSLHIPLPDDAPPTYWALTYDMRYGDKFDRGNDTFLVICRDALAESCLQTWKAGDRVRIIGRLVITDLRTSRPYGGEEVLPLAEVLAYEISAVNE